MAGSAARLGAADQPLRGKGRRDGGRAARGAGRQRAAGRGALADHQERLHRADRPAAGRRAGRDLVQLDLLRAVQPRQHQRRHDVRAHHPALAARPRPRALHPHLPARRRPAPGAGEDLRRLPLRRALRRPRARPRTDRRTAAQQPAGLGVQGPGPGHRADRLGVLSQQGRLPGGPPVHPGRAVAAGVPAAAPRGPRHPVRHGDHRRGGSLDHLLLHPLLLHGRRAGAGRAGGLPQAPAAGQAPGRAVHLDRLLQAGQERVLPRPDQPPGDHRRPLRHGPPACAAW